MRNCWDCIERGSRIDAGVFVNLDRRLRRRGIERDQWRQVRQPAVENEIARELIRRVGRKMLKPAEEEARRLCAFAEVEIASGFERRIERMPAHARGPQSLDVRLGVFVAGTEQRRLGLLLGV